ncbi:TVP38/TMEM64 family protein [Blastococcus capsensis]|uniref:TVP38/TMEM64 family protein n=1 Tax=Blastococcus capsensis TaxID=1564163 RepID=UPI00254068EE|nr:VTT domain-containing protein [Blastococcus capsensis]MDK3255805.1 VTT domain-containing protein [Blastococcus capsensis]
MRTGGERIGLRAAALVAVLLAGAVLALTVDLPSGTQVRTWLDGRGPEGWLLLVAGLAVVLVAPVPRSALSVLAGVVLGFGPGLAVAVAGGLLGAGAAFALGRVLGRPAVTRIAGPRLQRADRLLTERGFVSVLVGRLVPVVPFVVVNYAAGVGGVRFMSFLAATTIGLVPSTVVQVGIGASAGFVVARAGALVAVPTVVLGLLALGAGGAWWYRRRAGAGGAA